MTDRTKGSMEIAEMIIRRGECGSDEIVWGGIWNETNIGAALYGLFNAGLVDSSNIGCKLTAKGIQARSCRMYG